MLAYVNTFELNKNRDKITKLEQLAECFMLRLLNVL